MQCSISKKSPNAFFRPVVNISFSKSFFLLAAVCGLGDILQPESDRKQLEKPCGHTTAYPRENSQNHFFRIFKTLLDRRAIAWSLTFLCLGRAGSVLVVLVGFTVQHRQKFFRRGIARQLGCGNVRRFFFFEERCRMRGGVHLLQGA